MGGTRSARNRQPGARGGRGSHGARGLAPGDLAAIGITNQRETTVVWDRRTGEPVYNALVWQDTRVADFVAELARDGGQDRFRARTGLPLATYFSALKIRWILDNVAGARRAPKRATSRSATSIPIWCGI
jgi:glycerol kinase